MEGNKNMEGNKAFDCVLLTKQAKYALHNDYVITVEDVRYSIRNLKSGTSYGPDGIAAEAMKYGGGLLAVHLTLLFNMFVSHCYIPQDLIITTIVPLLKNKTGDASDVNNYRAIAFPNSLSKLLESVVLNCFQSCDKQNDFYQFGFKRKHSTSTGCFVLKNTIDYYRKHGSHVFVSLLDLSKAFDCVDHRILFSKLTDLELPCNLVKFLAYWYLHQLMNVRWQSKIFCLFLHA